MKTYAWIRDTAISRTTRTVRLLRIKIAAGDRRDVDILDLSRHRSRWPAVRFAIRRTLRVSGRIVLLTNSINTINLIRAGGVPLGTRWANMNSGCFIHE